MTVDNAIALLIALLSQADAIGRLIQNARNEGRDISQAELDALVAADDSARQALVDAIAKAKS
jgi:hypothetical protein